MAQGRKTPKSTWNIFLKALAENCASIATAARQAGIDPRTVYYEMNRNPDFAEKVQDIFSGIVVPLAESQLYALMMQKNLGAIKFILIYRGGERWNHEKIIKQLAEELTERRRIEKINREIFTAKRPSAAALAAAKAYEENLTD